MDIKELLNQLSLQEKDALYRELRSSYVRKDVLNRLEERLMDSDFIKGGVETIVKAFLNEDAIEGSYLYNIDYLINEFYDFDMEEQALKNDTKDFIESELNDVLLLEDIPENVKEIILDRFYYDYPIKTSNYLDACIYKVISEECPYRVSRGSLEFSLISNDEAKQFADPIQLKENVNEQRYERSNLGKFFDTIDRTYFKTKEDVLNYIANSNTSSSYYPETTTVYVTYFQMEHFNLEDDEFEITDIIPIVPDNIEPEINENNEVRQKKPKSRGDAR